MSDEPNYTFSDVTITHPDGTVETRPPYEREELDRIVHARRMGQQKQKRITFGKGKAT